MEDLSVVRVAKTRKIKELNLDQRYYVESYKPLNTKYGGTYILTIDDFEMWATKAIAKFITRNLKPKDKFSFKVNYCGQFGYYAEDFTLNDCRVNECDSVCHNVRLFW